MMKIKDYLWLSLIVGFTFIYDTYAQKKPPTPAQDGNLNWVSSAAYDFDGQRVSQSVQYFNNLGKPTQNQSWNILTDNIWVSQTLYDYQGRQALQTLSAPIGNNQFGLQRLFATNAISNTEYNVNNFDFVDESQGINRRDEPLRINPSSTLGSYYSNTNEADLYQDITEYPFSRTVFSRLTPGTVKKVLGGNKINGDWKQSYSFTMKAGDAIFSSRAFGNSLDSDTRVSKTVTRDVDGVDTVIYSDLDGNVIAAARSGNEDGAGYGGYNNTTVIGDQGWVDFHLGKGNPKTVLFGERDKNLSNPNDDDNPNPDDDEPLPIAETPIDVNQYLPNVGVDYTLLNEIIEIITTENINDEEGLDALCLANPAYCNFTYEDSNASQSSSSQESGISIPKPTGLFFAIYDLTTEALIDRVSPGDSSVLPKDGFYRAELRYGVQASFFYFTFNILNLPQDLIDFDYEAFSQKEYFVIHQANYYDFSLNDYDRSGRLISSTQPLSKTMESTFEYNSLGQLLKTKSPDEGAAQFLYRKDGQIRFSKNQEQFLRNEFSYTNYDELGRPIESGVYYLTNLSLAQNQFDWFSTNLRNLVDQPDGLNDRYCREQTYTVYDVPDASLTSKLNACGIDSVKFQQRFLSGNVSKTYTLNPETSTTWYSYDVYGRVKWIIQEINGLDCLKVLEYFYDPINGNLRTVIYQWHDSSEQFAHVYEYNKAQQLEKVKTFNGSSFETNIEYIYNDKNQLVREVVAENLQGVDYIYNLAGQLKAINHPSLIPSNDPGQDGTSGSITRSDVFGLAIDYYDGDYRRENSPTPVLSTLNASDGLSYAERYNGNIRSLSFKTNVSNPVNGFSTYAHTYNKNNWLTGAYFGSSSNSINDEINFQRHINAEYWVNNLSYDANGNIKTLKRNGYGTGTTNDMDDFEYHYRSSTNQLQTVEDTGDNNDPNRYQDLKNQYLEGAQNNYAYNTIGQMVSDTQEGTAYTYYQSGLVKSIRKFTPTDTGDYALAYGNTFEQQSASGIQPWKFNAGLGFITGAYVISDDDRCIPLEQHYGKGLVAILREQKVASRKFKLNSNTRYRMNLDVIVSQSEHSGIVPVNGDTEPVFVPTTLLVILRDHNNNIIDQHYYNPDAGIVPEYVENPLTYGGGNVLDNVDTPACNYFYETHPFFSFVSTGEEVTLEIQAASTSVNSTIHIDNVALSVAIGDGVSFKYNERGQRVQKRLETNTMILDTYYVRDATGNVMAIYEQAESKFTISGDIPLTLTENPVYGNSRIGVFKRSSNASSSYVYQLTDHLGNVRAVISKDQSGNALSLIAKTDYYPFGMPMPDRNVEGNYRYAFQGQEKDPETGMEAFEARLWDARIGRWLTVDPAGEFFSPYLGMGNNPISTIDPDGRCTKCPDNAAVGDTYNHPEYGTLTLGTQGWAGADGVNIMNDVILTSGGSALNDVGNVALGVSALNSAFDSAIPKLGINDFNLKSFNPSTGYATLEAFPGKVFENGTDDALRALGSLRTVTKLVGTAANVASFSPALSEVLEGNYSSSAVEAAGAGIGLEIGVTYGFAAGLAWASGWEGGRYLVNNSEAYNRKVFGIYSDIYIQRALVNRWDVQLNSTQMHLAHHRKLY